jgi:hypothetical protein
MKTFNYYPGRVGVNVSLFIFGFPVFITLCLRDYFCLLRLQIMTQQEYNVAVLEVAFLSLSFNISYQEKFDER